MATVRKPDATAPSSHHFSMDLPSFGSSGGHAGRWDGATAASDRLRCRDRTFRRASGMATSACRQDATSLATKSGMSTWPLGDPRPVAMLAFAPSAPDPKTNQNQDDSPPKSDEFPLWKALEGSE